MNILELANKLNITVPDFIHAYAGYIDDITEDNFENIREVIEYEYYQDHVHECADSDVPVACWDIEEVYKDSYFSIDDVMNEGLMEAMYDESDIEQAKMVAIFMSNERIIYAEIEDFILAFKKTDISSVLNNE